MKIVLYKPLVRPGYKKHSWYYLGFGYLKAYLRQCVPDIDVEVVYEEEQIRAANPDAVGFSTITEMWPRVLGLYARVREWFDGPVFFGGPHITALPQLLPPGRNVAFIGEAENALAHVARRMLRRENLFDTPVPGTACWQGSQFLVGPPAKLVDLNALPAPADPRSDQFSLTTVRGCPYHCTHCVEHAIKGRPRQLSAERMAELIIDRYDRYGTTVFELLDDLFLVSAKRLAEFVELLDKRGLLGKLEFQRVSLMAHLVTDEVARTLARLNLHLTGMGVESADPEIVRRFKSGIVTREHIERAIRALTACGVRASGSAVVGYPGETEAQLRNTIDFFAERMDVTTFRLAGVYVCQPLPGSQLWGEALSAGRVSADMDFSRLRIDADVRHFDSTWYYDNEAALPRQRLLEVLREYDLLKQGQFVPDASLLGKPRTNVFVKHYVAPQIAQTRTLEALRRWRDQDGRPVAVFGAGEHTRKVLPALLASPVEVSAVVDDSPHRIGKHIAGWQIVSPAELESRSIGAILISSDMYQEQLVARLRPLAERYRILTLYAPDELAACNGCATV